MTHHHEAVRVPLKKRIDGFLNKELRELYISLGIRTFALALIGIFIPIYLYQNSYTISEIALFYMLIFLVFAIFIMPAAKLVSKKGYKHSIALSLPVMIIPYLILSYFSNIKPLVFVGAGILGFSIAFFWIPFHLDIAKFSKKNKRGKQISVHQILTTIAGALAPIIGGLILTLTGFNLLFILVAIFLILAIIPLLFSKEVKEKNKFSVMRFLRTLHIRKMIGAGAYSASVSLQSIFWPLFVFLIVQEYVALGGLAAIIYIVSIGGAILGGFLVDKFDRSFLLKVSSIFYSIVLFSMTLIKNVLGVIGINVALGMVGPLHYTNVDALSYDYSRKNRLEEIVFREISFNTGRTLFFLMIVIIPNITFALILGAVAALLSGLYAKRREYLNLKSK